MRKPVRRFFESLEPRLTLDSTVVFNEIMYHPANDGRPEWIELHNQMSIDMDISNWRLSEGVNFTFPAGTVIPRQGYLVISADPAALAATSGFSGALGPWVGSLDNSGERIDLINNSDRILNQVEYDEDGAWPVGPDGTGATLAKRNEDAASDAAASWATSAQVGGTPGGENFPAFAPIVRDTIAVPVTGSWKYHDGGVDLGTTWKNTAFNDQSWASGNALLFDETSPLPAAKNTQLTPGRTTYYFRTTFDFTGDPTKTELRLRPIVDDGAVYYLNGVEVFRQNMPAGAVSYNTLATGQVGDANFAGPFTIPAGSLVAGTNVLAVEVHQGPIGGSNYEQTILTAQPIAYWRMSETSTAAGAVLDAASGVAPPQSGSQNGTFTGFNAANLGAAGPRPTDTIGGQSLVGFESDNRAPSFQGNLDGGDDVFAAPEAGVLNFAATRKFSLEAWVNAPAAQEAGAAIVSKGPGTGEQFTIDVVGNQYRFYVYNSSASPTVLQTSVSPNGTWQHVVATFDQSQGIMRVYVNGAQVASTTPPPTLLNNTADVTVGSRRSSPSSTYDHNLVGRIDEVAIYDRALTAAEVLAHYQAAFVAGGGGSGPALDDVVFGAELITRETLPDPASIQISFNEIASADAAAGAFFAEIVNRGSAVSLNGVVVASLGAVDAEHVLTGINLAAGQRLALTEAMLGYRPAVGDRLALFSPGKTAVLDAATVSDRLRGRSPEGTGNWRFPTAATPSAANTFDFADEVVINEIQYHARPKLSTPGTPATYQTTSLVAIDAATQWRYFLNTNNAGLATDWYETKYTTASAGWLQGPAPFGFEDAVLPEAIRTPVPNPSSPPANPFVRTYYFQTTFNVADPTAIDALSIRHMIDDGAVFYLNGQEIDGTRFNMPGVTGDPVLASASATAAVGNATFIGPSTVSPSLLRAGENVLSVEVHQFGITTSSDIVFAVELQAAVEVAPAVPGTPFADDDLEWLELHNRSATPVNLENWKLKEAIDYTFPAGTTIPAGGFLVIANNLPAFAAAYPGVAAIGPYSGSLNNGSDRVLLDDAVGNPADEVTYFDGGRWPEAADGAGASLELRDPDADNSRGEAWAASNEGARSEWRTYTYRGPATNSMPGAPTLWQEFAFGLLDGAGEVWIDDVSVIETPSTTPIQRIQNGSFTAGANTWRMLGTHQRSQVIAEPGNTGNMILRLVASGPTEYQGNQIETTFGGGAQIVEGREYEISFRAKWISGSSQINSRLYFTRLARTTPLVVPTTGGSPGVVNTRRETNIGPTFDGLTHGPVVPAANVPVTVSVAAADPDGIATMAVKYAVNGGAWQTAAMTLQANGRYAGTIPGQSASALVQFYVEGQDSLGAIAQFPAAGPASRAMIRWNDNQASTGLLHNFRILMTQADSDYMHYGPNTTSNEALGATVIYNESEIFYNVGVHLKGSFVGRDTSRTGFHIKFNDDQLFRGIHDKVAIDRSQTVSAISPTETLIQVIGNHAGELPSRYDDLVYVIAPRSAQTSVGHMRLAGWDEIYLDEQYENGSDGNQFDFETPRWATATIDGNPQSIKQSGNVGNGFANVDIQNLGDDKETYRWTLNLINNRERDDYEQLIAMAKAFSLSGTALDAATAATMDIDQWMRVFALQSLGGVDDGYNWNYDHNLRLYQRPDDNKIVPLPWDWDNIFQNPNRALVGGDNLGKIINRPQNLHHYYGHLQNIIATTFHTSYMAYWTNHYGQVAQRDYSWVLSYIGQRASFVTSQLASVAPQIPFTITTNGGNNFSVNATTATLEGTGWINVRTIRIAGRDEPLDVTWLDQTRWRASVPVAFGANALSVRAFDFQGNAAGSDTITITSTVSDRPIEDFLRVSELMYHPRDPSASEFAAGFENADDFEFIEFHNTSDSVTLNLAGVRFDDGVDFTFPAGATSMLPPGGYLVVVRDAEAFAARYPGSTAVIAGEFTGQFNNAGEEVVLVRSAGEPIQSFTYDDTGAGWHPTTDGDGYSLVFRDPHEPIARWNDGDAWRPSGAIDGSPGESDSLLVGDFNSDGRVDLADLALLQGWLGTPGGATVATGDLTGDGAVTRADVAVFGGKFGAGTPAGPSPVAPASAVVRQARVAANVAGANLVASRRVRAAIVDRVIGSEEVVTQLVAPRNATRELRGSAVNQSRFRVR